MYIFMSPSRFILRLPSCLGAGFSGAFSSLAGSLQSSWGLLTVVLSLLIITVGTTVDHGHAFPVRWLVLIIIHASELVSWQSPGIRA
ncbi:hypothetical protein cypCar_00012098 [Cyprinus carpio]|nr:hypothetical protein cypCar_00012098 [Cyprinus carpio]